MRLGVIGALGKMGKRIVFLSSQDPTFQSTIALTTKEKTQDLPQVDIIIDFSTKDALLHNLNLAKKIPCPLVIGTTGLDEDDKEALNQAARELPIFWAPNFSLGMAATLYAARLLASSLQDFDSYIEEIHHVHKKDAPSGSALALQEALQQGSLPKPPLIKSIREGEVIGKHTVVFSSLDESVTLSHEAFSRDIFAKGALVAAKFLIHQKPGLYTMDNLFKEKIQP